MEAPWLPLPALVKYHVYLAVLQYGPGIVLARDVRRYPYRSLLKSWIAVAHHGAEKSFILESIVRAKKAARRGAALPGFVDNKSKAAGERPE